MDYLKYIIQHDNYRNHNPYHFIMPVQPPKKGTKRYKKQQHKAKKRARRDAVNNVLNLINSLEICV